MSSYKFSRLEQLKKPGHLAIEPDGQVGVDNIAYF